MGVLRTELVCYGQHILHIWTLRNSQFTHIPQYTLMSISMRTHGRQPYQGCLKLLELYFQVMKKLPREGLEPPPETY